MRHIATIALIATVLAACQRQGDSVVPRREAYPRIDTPAPAYAPALCAVPFLVNVNARVDTIGLQGQWLTVGYPAYDAKLYVSLTPVTAATVNEAVDNRLQRIDLNFGGAPVEAASFATAGGYECTVALTHSPIATPVQFIAIPAAQEAADTAYLVSGALFVNSDGATAEQIHPIVRYIAADITHALENL